MTERTAPIERLRVVPPIWAVLLGVLLLPACPAKGQMLRGPSLGGSAGFIEVTLREADEEEAILVEGTAYGLEGAVGVSLVELELRYLESRVAGYPGVDDVRLVEGSLTAGVRFHPWLRVEGGPRIRGLLGPWGTRRLVTWDAGTRLRVPVFRDRLWATGAISGTLGGSSNARGPVHRGTGGEVGLLFNPTDRGPWASVRFQMDRVAMEDRPRSEYGTRVFLSLGFRMR